MADGNGPNLSLPVTPTRYRPQQASRRQLSLFHSQSRSFTVRPIITRIQPPPEAPACAAQVQFRYHYCDTYAIDDIPATHAGDFCNKATVLYTHCTSVQQCDSMLGAVFELWRRLTAGLELAPPRYGHYLLASLMWSSEEPRPALLEVINSHKALARRVRQLEGQMRPRYFAGTAPGDALELLDPFPRCLLMTWGGEMPRTPEDLHTWLVAEKRLVGDIGDEVKGSGEGDYVWVCKKMELTDALELICALPEEKLEGSAFRIQYEERVSHTELV